MLIAFFEDSFVIACPDSIVCRPLLMEMASRSIPAADHNNRCKSFKSVAVFSNAVSYTHLTLPTILLV